MAWIRLTAVSLRQPAHGDIERDIEEQREVPCASQFIAVQEQSVNDNDRTRRCKVLFDDHDMVCDQIMGCTAILARADSAERVQHELRPRIRLRIRLSARFGRTSPTSRHNHTSDRTDPRVARPPRTCVLRGKDRPGARSATVTALDNAGKP
jgi:hypothetical protein